MSSLIVSIIGISAVVVAFIIIFTGIYCFMSRYSRWIIKEESGNETEEIIGREIAEIAKYTIGEEEEDGIYADTDDSDSSHSNEEALGLKILQSLEVHLNVPEIPNPSIESSEEEEEEESSEEQCRQDLLMAKQVLYASMANGTNEPYSVYTVSLNDTTKIDKSSKKSALLDGGESSDYKVSSDTCNNSDLP